MLQLRDILVLLALARAGDGWTIRSMGAAIGLGPASVHRSLQRLGAVGLYSPLVRAVNPAVLHEFLCHGLRFVDARQLGAEQRGVPTAWGAEPLRSEIWNGASPPPVWPHPDGSARGPSLEPIAPNAAELVDRAPDIATDLALVDAVRVGSARERSRAAAHLVERLVRAAA